MNWHFWAAVVAGLVAASLIDWLFAGVLFHDRYLRYPEVWRTPGNNTRGIIAAQVLTIPTVLGTMALLALLGAVTMGSALLVATLVWAIAAAPATIVNGIFVKIDPAVVAAHAIGWLVKLLAIAAIAVVPALIDCADAVALDAADPLAFARARFALRPGIIYLDGNSLGALPRRTAARVADTITREWGERLIGSWNDAGRGDGGWIEAPARIGAKIARLVGAAADEVIVTDSVSVNVFKLAAAALGLRSGRRTIVTEAGNFPTDVYMLQGLAALAGCDLRIVAPDDVTDALDESVALLLLTQTHYRTGTVRDLTATTAAAHAAGALMAWDLSHSVGALAVDLTTAQADMAVGCGYKFLNGGPGAPAFAYVARRHHADLAQPLSGWIGHAEPFAFDDDYRPAPGVARLLSGTPGMLGMAALASGVATFDGVDMGAAAAKSMALGDFLIALVEERCPTIAIACPREHRGAQVSLAHPHAYEITQALIARGVIGDFRPPDVLRLGLPALYVRFVDVWDAVDRLAAVVANGEWERPEFAVRQAVT